MDSNNIHVINILSPIFAAIITSLSLGNIITAWLNKYLEHNNKIETIDIERYNLYKDIYFNGVKDGIRNMIPIEQSKQYFLNLYSYLLIHDELSILLSEQVLILLNKYNKTTDEKQLKILQKRIENDFNIIKKKFGSPFSIRKDKFKYLIALFGVIFFSFTIIILIVSAYAYSQIPNIDYSILLIIIYSIILTLTLTWRLGSYLYKNAYIFDI